MHISGEISIYPIRAIFYGVLALGCARYYQVLVYIDIPVMLQVTGVLAALLQPELFGVYTT
ncbi:hypothetical protein Dd703_2478 [Musicola paradisiaca Ech703]|uniref:Uncharacterized protein n=1 Tax=Musicola paradisiaca (strain Ech703) TaxID=579405 RepID=C6C957_MUSP7|nr:hypothetical protein Dd703_2478 [Musicola paradisiaca Ech703]